MLCNLFIYALIYAVTYLCTCVKESKLHYISYYNFMFEVININIWQIWDFDIKGIGRVSLQLSIILMQTVRRFDM